LPMTSSGPRPYLPMIRPSRVHPEHSHRTAQKEAGHSPRRSSRRPELRSVAPSPPARTARPEAR
jgi:hypothetical protein